jgi:hypothetical protein
LQQISHLIKSKKIGALVLEIISRFYSTGIKLQWVLGKWVAIMGGLWGGLGGILHWDPFEGLVEEINDFWWKG